MTAMNNPPSIRRIDSGRPDLFAVEVAGHVSAADIENLYGLLEGAYVTQERIDLLIRVVDNEGVDWGEVSPQTVEAAQEHAREHITRCAAVGESSATRRIAEIFCPDGAELRHFATDAEDEAWEWLG
ncbi:MAG: STAS/SEC14 domain-containing protein [Rhizobiaceae bacterium]|nr:STAS/SEC14 domain-containing protein [Rhizobiaceae bacterium]MBO6726059.1 STAS/SEC14 domain-containing protein [Rhizobiaceae bacterium]